MTSHSVIGWSVSPLNTMRDEVLILSRTAVLVALQHWLAETPQQRKTASQPGYLTVGLSCAWTRPIIRLDDVDHGPDADRSSSTLSCRG